MHRYDTIAEAVTDRMNDAELKRKLRDLRRYERRLCGDPSAPVFREYFALEEGVPARYPFGVLRVLDDRSRARAVREYLAALFGISHEDPPERTRLLAALDLPPDATDDMVTHAFRSLALEIHPDQGGDNELMSELAELYRRWLESRA